MRSWDSISIHAPREGCDEPPTLDKLQGGIFQSTHPVRGATLNYEVLAKMYRISIHAPREGCDHGWNVEPARTNEISIHAPREGCDPNVCSMPTMVVLFQSTHPVRGATGGTPDLPILDAISIHAPREGCDQRMRMRWKRMPYFNPRTP